MPLSFKSAASSHHLSHGFRTTAIYSHGFRAHARRGNQRSRPLCFVHLQKKWPEGFWKEWNVECGRGRRLRQTMDTIVADAWILVRTKPCDFLVLKERTKPCDFLVLKERTKPSDASLPQLPDHKNLRKPHYPQIPDHRNLRKLAKTPTIWQMMRNIRRLRLFENVCSNNHVFANFCKLEFLVS